MATPGARGQVIERRLAAILVADVAGYSRLMGEDEVGTLRALAEHRREVLEPEIAGHHGRIVKTTGDGVLAEFASAVSAVACAAAIQRAMATRNAEVASDRRLAFRIGLNLGDIIVESGDIYGDGVNVAARLEALAEPGGLAISGTIHEQVRDKLPFAFADHGEQTVKNIGRPVHVWTLGASALAALAESPRAARAASARPRRWWPLALGVALAAVLVAAAAWFAVERSRRPLSAAAPSPALSIVVLPFASFGGEPGQDYLADIITEELTTSLARLPKSFVIARSTAFTYKGKNIGVKQLHDELGVRYVLEGSEQHDGQRVRINAQLIDAESGAHLWADQFDADRADLLQMQDEIVTRLSRTLQLQFVDIEAARIAQTPPADLKAEDLAMQCSAGFLNARFASSRLDQVYALCERALSLDPRNVRALIELSFRAINRVLDLSTTDRDGDLRQAGEYVARALALAPNNAVAHFARSELLLAERRFDEAIDEAQQALALDPSFVNAYSSLSLATAYSGEAEKTLEYTDRAMRLSPRDRQLFLFQFIQGFALVLAGRGRARRRGAAPGGGRRAAMAAAAGDAGFGLGQCRPRGRSARGADGISGVRRTDAADHCAMDGADPLDQSDLPQRGGAAHRRPAQGGDARAMIARSTEEEA
jgi:class 3 adenylate cyclase/TolB-like protein